MVQENRIEHVAGDGFEAEGDVADTEGGEGAGQVFLDPLNSFKGVFG